MFKKLRKIVVLGAALMGAVAAHGATTRYVELRSTLQPNTTGVNAINVSSGSIRTFTASTATVSGPLTVTGLATLGSATITGTATLSTIAGTITDNSTTTHTGGHTFSSSTITAASIGTMNGTTTDNSTTTHNGAHTFSTMTVTDARFLAMTVSGAIKDRTLSTGTTWDYLLGGSSSTWTHAGLILQSTQCFVVAPTTASSTANFGGSSIKVTLTPKFANSIMRINFHGMLSNSVPSNDTCELSIFKNGTNMLGGTTDWIRYSMTNAAAANFPVMMGPYNDTSSASAITYQVFIRNSAGGNTCTLGTAGGNGLVVDEIGQ